MYGYREKAHKKFRTAQDIAIILAHADRLERSAARFSFLRFFLLWLLRPVERAARSYVFNYAGSVGAPDLPLAYGLLREGVCRDGIEDSATEALALAWQMRTLASLIGIITAIEDHLNAADSAATKKRDRRLGEMCAASRQAVHVRRACASHLRLPRHGRPEVRPALTDCPGGSGRFVPA